MRSGFAILAALSMFASAAAAPATIPFVGCPSDGQVGPDPAPTGKPVAVSLETEIASRLAFYQSKYDNGVLAPRGWHCANLEGSNGWILILVPEQLNATALLDPKKHPLKGPAIQFTVRDGGTSGRFEVAKLIARYFPERRAFLQSVVDEKIEPASNFPSGPFAADQLVMRQKHLVEYLTPADREGLGTKSRLLPSELPIHAFAAVIGSDDEDLAGFMMSVRLPKSQDDLAPVILHWAEQRYASGK